MIVTVINLSAYLTWCGAVFLFLYFIFGCFRFSEEGFLKKFLKIFYSFAAFILFCFLVNKVSLKMLAQMSELSFVEMKLTGEYELLGLNDKYFWFQDENGQLQSYSLTEAITHTAENSSSKIEEYTSYYENPCNHKLVEFLLSENFVKSEVSSYVIYIGQVETEDAKSIIED